MRKTIFLLLIASVVALSVTGCKSPAPSSNKTEKPAGEMSNAENYPDEVKSAVETIRTMQVGMAVYVNNKTYLIVSYGEKPTAGYKASITSTEKQGDKLIATTALSSPNPGAQAAQVLTYPYVVKVVDGFFKEVFFKDPAGEEFPQVLGLKGKLSSINRSSNSNIIVSSLTTGQNGIKARGIARVFEATVGYEIQDEAGNKLTNGYINAAAGGPNWGYFELVLNELPKDAARLQLFQPSAMDGSKLDLVELKLK